MKPLTNRVAYHSAKGRRSSNQDAVVVGVLANGRSVAAVADGMGGRLAGDVASRRALEVMIEGLRNGDDLAASVEAANRVVFSESNADPDLHGMGTTVVVMLQEEDRYLIANVGDSRAYRLSADGISRVTADHSFTAEAVEAGEMTPEDAVLSPWANALTRAIGTDPHVEVDVFGPFDATESHAILLCSDGFHKPLSDDGILISVLGADGENAASDLTEVALRAGSDDNVTIALVSFGDRSWRDKAVQARNNPWDLEDAATEQFAQSGGQAGAVEDEDVGVGEPPVWVLPDSTGEGHHHPRDEDGLIQAGFINEPMRRVGGDADAASEPDDGGTAVGVASDESSPEAEGDIAAGEDPGAAEAPLGAPSGGEAGPPSVDGVGSAAPTPDRRRRARTGFSVAVGPARRRLTDRGRNKALLSVIFLVATALVVLALLQVL